MPASISQQYGDTALGYVFGAINEYGSPDIALPPGPGANDYAHPTRAFPVLHEAGFSECRQFVVSSQWQVDDPGAPYDFFLEGIARGGALLRPEPSKNAASIQEAVEAKVVEKHGPGPCTLRVGQFPDVERQMAEIA